MRARRFVTTGAFVIGLVWSSSPAWAGALKVMSVDQRGMVVLDSPTVQRDGQKVTAKVLTVSNQGYVPLAYYQHPLRSSLSVSCDSETFSVNGQSAQPIVPQSAVDRTAGFLCKGIVPEHSTEVGSFGPLARAYLAYIVITPGVFFVYQ